MGLNAKGQIVSRANESKDFQHVLDMGCGTGIWTINFGKTSS
jgi:predicted TPR repeat methyltransferase